MAASAISCVVTNLSSLIQKEVGLLWGVEDDMRKLSSTLSTILAVLDDAEMKQHQDKSILNWLRKLKDAAYKIGDILDQCETHALIQEVNGRNSGSLKKVCTSAITCYPVVNLTFRHKIGNKMKEIIGEINGISEERNRFHLNERFMGKGIALAEDSRETSSALPPLEVFGRQLDREKIVKVLTEDGCDLDEFSVYPIVGMGGLGKTTLAQMIFNDDIINSHFVLKIWVYVSQNFSVKMVLNQIIESTSGQTCDASRLEILQEKAKDMLSGKRFLLVLDDAWSEDQEEWDKLKPVLACGLPGSCVVVTTRSEMVASIIRTHPTHYLLPLSEDDCWLLFRQRAFGSGNEEHPELVHVGKRIVKKCGGVPLAAKTLGGLMRFRRGEEEWLNIAESNLWDIPEVECSILPALRLSYYNLPLELRHCFSYCAIFPKGSKIEKDKLIHLWMANGFISSKNKIEVEYVGNQVCYELYMRSFFQDVEIDGKGKTFVRMHDLMHDLSQFLGDDCQIVDVQASSNLLMQRVRHATFIESNRPGEFPQVLSKQWPLHTILLQPRNDHIYFPYYASEYSWCFKNLGSLRVLDASGFQIKKVSGSVGNSKHLRYLNLSGCQIKKLPASICGLLNLQTLNLNNCSKLMALPKKMYNLRDLRHLYLLGCHRVEDMPLGLGKLTKLKTLSLFVVGKKNGQRLGELHHLNLGGELSIKHLERVNTSIDAKDANLAGKPNLRIVRLTWEFTWKGVIEEQQEEVIKALEPHPNIVEVSIQRYQGKELPVWLGNPSLLRNITSIKLIDCIYCTRLPGLGQLPLLKRLEIRGIGKLEYLMIGNGSNLRTGGVVVVFPSLEMLEITGLINLKGLVSKDDEEKEEEGREHQQKHKLLPRLKWLVIDSCRQLATLPTLPVLESLKIRYTINMDVLNWISKLASLTSLVLDCDWEMVCFPNEMFQNLSRLQTLRICGYKKLKTLPGNMSSLVSLSYLLIRDCDELECFPDDGGIGCLTSLLSMHTYKCPKKGEEERSQQLFPHLRRINISGCPKLLTLPTQPVFNWVY